MCSHFISKRKKTQMNINTTYTLSSTTAKTNKVIAQPHLYSLSYAKACTYDRTVTQTKRLTSDELRENRIEFSSDGVTSNPLTQFNHQTK